MYVAELILYKQTRCIDKPSKNCRHQESKRDNYNSQKNYLFKGDIHHLQILLSFQIKKAELTKGSSFGSSAIFSPKDPKLSFPFLQRL
jgi:hypothetical protein